MRKVILVEPPPGRAKSMERVLATRGYDVEVAPTTGSAIDVIKTQIAAGSDLVGIIVSWPVEDGSRAFTRFSEILRSHRLSHLAVLLMVETMSSRAIGWLKYRKRSAMLLWSDYSETPDALARLLDPNRERRMRVMEELADHHLKVLFVDDSPTVRIAFRRLLMKHGFLVETAASAAEGYSRALEGEFDMAIIDYFMPEQNGTALVARLKAHPRTRMIMSAVITGTYSDTVINDSLVAGAVECIFKNEARELFLTRIGSMARSIIDRKSIDNERRRLEGILKSVGDGVYGVDNRGVIQFINPTALEILGFDNEVEAIGAGAHELFHHRSENGSRVPASSCHLTQCYRSGEQVSGWQTVFWSRTGRVISVECTVLPLQINGQREGSVVAFRDVSARKLLEEELRWQATHDSLTKLPNRSHFEDDLEQEVRRLQRSDQMSALLYLDLDRFKYINDTAGHAAGDRLLVDVAKRLKGRLRMSDTLARIGGDEYAIILRNVRADSIVAAADHFRKALDDSPFVHENRQYVVSATIGIAIMDRNTQTPGEIMANADIACHLAKSEGRNRTHLFRDEDDHRRSLDLELGWSARLKKALKENLFVLAYQPILETDDIDGAELPQSPGTLWQTLVPTTESGTKEFEVLLRLNDSDGKLTAPDAFLPTAERFNMMVDIDRWTIEHSLQRLAQLKSEGEDGIRFVLNLSEQSLLEPQTLGFIVKQLRHYNVAPAKLRFEIPEMRALTHMEATTAFVAALRKLGVGVGLDDFGTGFASFAYLRKLDVEYLKIDGSYLKASTSDPISVAVFGAISRIAHALGKRTVAKCVEDDAMAGAMLKAGIDMIQGHYVARPSIRLDGKSPEKVTSIKDHRRQVS